MIETYTLQNGVRIVSEHVPGVRSVSIGIWVFTGSRNEVEEINGVSHFLEHMMFKGTKNRTAQQIAEEFDSIGGHVNAFTGKEYTCYYARVLDTYKEYALEILSDMFFHSTFLQDELEREKKVILEEIKMYEDTPDSLVHDLLATALFGEHALGRPILGTEAHIKQMTRDMLIKYMEEHYIPNNIVLSIAGNIDEGFIQTIEKQFSSLDRKNHSVERIQPQFEFNSMIRHKDTEQAHLCLGYEGLAAKDDSLVSLMLVNNALGRGMSSRLFQEIREKRGLAYSVFSYHSAYVDSGMLVIYAGTNKDQISELIDVIEYTLEDLVEKGLNEEELENKKRQLKGNILLSLENTNSRMTRNGRNELLLGKHRTLDEITEEIDRVTVDHINQTIKRIFTEKRAQAIIQPEE